MPYGKQSVNQDDIDAVVRVLRGDWLTTGPAVNAFEKALAEHTGGGTCVAVTSGTAALHTAYAAARIGPGDEVITPPTTFVATQSTAVACGATIRFADVQEDTANIDPDCVGALICDRTRAVVAVDYAGHPADLDELRQLADRHGLLLIEDAAHSVGSTYRGRPVGSIADLTTFSFFPTKNVTTGEGGAISTFDANLARRMRHFRNHGLVRDQESLQHPDEGPWHQEVQEFGLNYRLPDILAALGVSQLARLSQFKRRRAQIVATYNALLADVPGISLPAERAYVEPMWHLYPLRVHDGRRRRVFESLRSAGIGVQVNYVPAYWHPAFEAMGYRRGLCPNSERFYEQEISLPLFPSLSDADVERVANSVIHSLRRLA
ncbi:MAG: UDP-4-amino-4,6-dideoxy-N-acetyl-beta-L-altrosamine transaminase [Actinomycetes bacterium]